MCKQYIKRENINGKQTEQKKKYNIDCFPREVPSKHPFLRSKQMQYNCQTSARKTGLELVLLAMRNSLTT